MIDNVTDWFRMANAVVALIIVVLMFVDRNAPWREPMSTLRMFTTSVALVFVWQIYTSIEVIVESPQESGGGLRVFGFTIIYSIVLLALLIERRRAKRTRRALTMTTDVVIITKPPGECP